MVGDPRRIQGQSAADEDMTPPTPLSAACGGSSAEFAALTGLRFTSASSITAAAVCVAFCAGRRLPISAEQEAAAPAVFVDLLKDCWPQEPKRRPMFEYVSVRLDEIRSADAARAALQSPQHTQSRAAIRTNPVKMRDADVVYLEMP